MTITRPDTRLKSGAPLQLAENTEIQPGTSRDKALKIPQTRARTSCVASGETKANMVPRTSCHKVSDSLSAVQCSNLCKAAEFSNRIGMPLNRFCSAHFGLVGLYDREGLKALSAFLKLVREWVWRQGGELTYLWTRETAEHGTHAHILFHVPDQLDREIKYKLWRLFKQACDGAYVQKAHHSCRIVSRSPHIHSRQEKVMRHKGVLDYVLKGANPEAKLEHGLQNTKPCGRVVGKRCGTSQNIGKKARAEVVL